MAAASGGGSSVARWRRRRRRAAALLRRAATAASTAGERWRGFLRSWLGQARQASTVKGTSHHGCQCLRRRAARRSQLYAVAHHEYRINPARIELCIPVVLRRREQLPRRRLHRAHPLRTSATRRRCCRGPVVRRPEWETACAPRSMKKGVKSSPSVDHGRCCIVDDELCEREMTVPVTLWAVGVGVQRVTVTNDAVCPFHLGDAVLVLGRAYYAPIYLKNSSTIGVSSQITKIVAQVGISF